MATNKRGQAPEEVRCKRCRSPGSEYCIFHGGRAPKGGAHLNFKHGRRSRYMPSELFEHFNRFVNQIREEGCNLLLLMQGGQPPEGDLLQQQEHPLRQGTPRRLGPRLWLALRPQAAAGESRRHDRGATRDFAWRP